MKRFSSVLPAILAGALLSGAMRLWANAGSSDTAEVLFAATLLPGAALGAWLLGRWQGLQRRGFYMVGDLLSLLLYGLASHRAELWVLAVPVSVWAVLRGQRQGGIALLTAALCRVLANILGTESVETVVVSLAIVPLFVTRPSAKTAFVSPANLAFEPKQLLAQVAEGVQWALIFFASFHAIVVISPVAQGPLVALLLGIAAARVFADFKKIVLAPLDRVLLFSLAWLVFPGLLDRNLYPLLSSTAFWAVGWFMAIVPWGASLGPAPAAASPVFWVGVLAAAGLARLEPKFVTEPGWLAGSLAVTLLPTLYCAWPAKHMRKGSWVLVSFGIAAVAATSFLRLGAGPEERVLDGVLRIGRILSVVRPIESKAVTLRDRFHQRSLSSETDQELRRQGLLPFRLHSGSPLKRLLVLGAGNPYAVSSALELPELARLTWVDADSSMFELSRWWTSAEAAKNSGTRAERIVARPDRYLRDPGANHWDAAVVSPVTPWSEEGTAYYSPGLPALIRDRLYADGVAIQWVQTQQWTESELFELFRRWREAFDDRVELWRSDLSPYSPYLAIVARGAGASTDLRGARPSELPDGLFKNPFTSLSLRLTDASGLQELMGPPVSRRPPIDNAWLSAMRRSRGDDLLGPSWLIRRMEAPARRLGGPSEGGFRYTRAAIQRAQKQVGWQRERVVAVEQMGFDPTDHLYQELFPKQPDGLPAP
jgi:hypothetical protein